MKGSSISASTPSSEEKVDLRSSFFFCLIWPKCREDKKTHCKNKKQGSCEEMKDKLWNIWQADTGRFRVNRVSFYGSAPTLRRTRGMMWNTFKGARGPTHLVSIYPVTGRHALWPLYIIYSHKKDTESALARPHADGEPRSGRPAFSDRAAFVEVPPPHPTFYPWLRPLPAFSERHTFFLFWLHDLPWKQIN